MKLPRRSVDRVLKNFSNLDLGDPRRVRRLRRVVARMARAPQAPLPAAFGGDAPLLGAYRLANNRRVNFEQLMGVQTEVTRQRADEAGSVLVIHDTTDCAFPHLDPRELGYLHTGKAGFMLHYALVVDAREWRRPLGVVHAEVLFRKKRSGRGSRKRKISGDESAKWADREYGRWQRGMLSSADALSKCPEVIHVADREGDSYELMTALLAAKQRLVIRVSKGDRRGRHFDDDSDEWSTVRTVATGVDGMVEREVPLSRRPGKPAPHMNATHRPRKARLARLRFSATRVVLPRPRYLRDPVPEQLELNVVHVVEVNPPPNEAPVEWMLYTTEPVTTPKQVEKVVDTYRVRWTIEELNAALKTGTAYEARGFESRHALLVMLALSLPIACEVLWLRSQARSGSDLPASAVLDTEQLRTLRRIGNYRLPPRPTAQDALLAVAALGGHLKRNGPPGWKVLQRGMQKLIAHDPDDDETWDL